MPKTEGSNLRPTRYSALLTLTELFRRLTSIIIQAFSEICKDIEMNLYEKSDVRYVLKSKKVFEK